jgi:hypothetical protein
MSGGLNRLRSIMRRSPFVEDSELAGDWRRVQVDVEEALRTGREPEDVQAERHARERAEQGLD